ncbi:hypothetical protein BJX68DRAFT_233003 [Aspergillus pseudodeflectus]|uniref:Zn(2)-C6 fungal-type domain-containing protein n=1 Tax=Aspergillus pseudodeflectus TaxID=176178 RepID=A0ABR4KPI0_9EURO
MAPQMPNACLTCAVQKRKCDKTFPACLRCARSKTNRQCVYRGPFDDQLTGYSSGPLVPSSPSFKSAVNCEKCRAGKRACSRDLPVCLRCKRQNTPCDYELGKAYSVDANRRSIPVQSWSPRDRLSKVTISPQPFEDLELSRVRHSISPLALSAPQYKPRYPIPERDYFPKLIRYYTEACCMPSSYVVQDSLMAHINSFWMSRALADPCLFSTLLYNASAHRDMVHGIPHTYQTLYHHSQVLKILRKRLEEGRQITYETAASVISLTFYSMSGYNTDSALIHRNGLLHMLAKSQNQGPEFEPLTALANLILLGLTVVVNEDPPIIPPVNTSTQTDAFTFGPGCMPSNLLRRAVRSGNRDSLLSSDTVFELQDVLDFIDNAEHVPISDLYTLHATTRTKHPTETSPKAESPSPTSQTARIINECCHLATDIFWSLVQNALYPESPSSADDPSTPVPRTSFEMVGAVFLNLDILTWKKHNPEAYLWVALTAAAACDKPESRASFVAVVPPVLTAADTKELLLARECWRYYKWLSGISSSRAEERNVDRGPVTELAC